MNQDHEEFMNSFFFPVREYVPVKNKFRLRYYKMH